MRMRARARTHTHTHTHKNFGCKELNVVLKHSINKLKIGYISNAFGTSIDIDEFFRKILNE